MCKKNIHNKKYQGKFVAMAATGSNEVVASGSDANVVANKARKQGSGCPIVFFVPKENTTYLF